MLVVVANEVTRNVGVRIEDGDITYNVDTGLAKQILNVLQTNIIMPIDAKLRDGILMRITGEKIMEYEYPMVTRLDAEISKFNTS